MHYIHRLMKFRSIRSIALLGLLVPLLLTSSCLPGQAAAKQRELANPVAPLSEIHSPVEAGTADHSAEESKRLTSDSHTKRSPMGSAPNLAQGRLAGRRICLDPGHDAVHVPGAVARDEGGRLLFYEQDLTLQVAYRLKPLLEQEGAQVCVTRDTDGRLQQDPYDFNGNETTKLPEDVAERTQPRIDWMNRFAPEVVLSIHFNGFSDPSVSGTEVYYSDTGDHHHSNRKLAQWILDALLERVRSAGYSPINRGIRSDKYKVEYLPFTHFYGFDRTCSECTRLMTLGNNPMSKNRGQWTAGALVEVVFLSNPQDVQFLQRPDAVDIIARGLAQGILNYFGEQQ